MIHFSKQAVRICIFQCIIYPGKTCMDVNKGASRPEFFKCLFSYQAEILDKSSPSFGSTSAGIVWFFLGLFALEKYRDIGNRYTLIVHIIVTFFLVPPSPLQNRSKYQNVMIIGFFRNKILRKKPSR